MFEPIKAILGRVLAEKKMKATFDAAEVCVVAEKIIVAELPELSERVRVKFIKNGVLTVAVESSAVGQELQLASATILDALKKRYSQVRKLRMVVEQRGENDIS